MDNSYGFTIPMRANTQCSFSLITAISSFIGFFLLHNLIYFLRNIDINVEVFSTLKEL